MCLPGGCPLRAPRAVEAQRARHVYRRARAAHGRRARTRASRGAPLRPSLAAGVEPCVRRRDARPLRHARRQLLGAAAGARPPLLAADDTARGDRDTRAPSSARGGVGGARRSRLCRPPCGHRAEDPGLSRRAHAPCGRELRGPSSHLVGGQADRAAHPSVRPRRWVHHPRPPLLRLQARARSSRHEGLSDARGPSRGTALRVPARRRPAGPAGGPPGSHKHGLCRRRRAATRFGARAGRGARARGCAGCQCDAGACRKGLGVALRAAEARRRRTRVGNQRRGGRARRHVCALACKYLCGEPGVLLLRVRARHPRGVRPRARVDDRRRPASHV
mmetsp:Transcript_3797/g.12114  ORF Transcript_3797/g.12114 Transcript_3797/m.12114 type:complete len:333 (-) Transcript_3797:116-1114(-)